MHLSPFMYVTQEYDFHAAISKHLQIPISGSELVIYRVLTVTDNGISGHIDENANIVETNYGKFYCEGFEDPEATIYMKVCPII